MEGEVQLPAVGQVKKRYVVIGAGVVAGIVGYAYWRQRQAAAAAPIPAYSDADVTPDDSEVTDTAGGLAGATADSGGAVNDETDVPTSDQEWVQDAAEVIGGSYDSGSVYTALGLYITHQPVSADQAAIISAAIGAMGYPPGGNYPIDTQGGASPSTFGVPGDVHQIGTTTNSVSLEWTAVPGASGYHVWRSGDSTPTDTSGTTVTIGGLEPNTSYGFQVAARDATGNAGPKSTSINVRTTTVSLKAPSGLKATAVGTTSVTMACSAVSGAQYYRWYVNGESRGASDNPTYTIYDLKPGTKYSVTVAADTTEDVPGPLSAKYSVTTKKK